VPLRAYIDDRGTPSNTSDVKTSNFGHAQKLGTIESADSKFRPGLQVADLLAYLTLKRTRDNPAVNQEVEIESPLGQAIRNARDVNLDFKLLGRVASTDC
jgi:hypothetical protein